MNFEKALELAANFVEKINQDAQKSKLARLTGIIPEKHVLCESYGETQDKYIFKSKPEKGSVPPSSSSITVNKKTGECKYEYLEREDLAPYAPIRGYKKINI